MSVALGAADGQSQPDGPCRRHPINHRVKSIFKRINAALLVEHGIAVKARRNLLIRGGAR